MNSVALQESALRLQEKLAAGEPLRTLVLLYDTEEDRNCDFSFLGSVDVQFLDEQASLEDVERLLANKGYDYVLNFTSIEEMSVVSLGAASAGGGPFHSKRSIREAGVPVPRIYRERDEDIVFPVIVKPNDTSGSIGVRKVFAREHVPWKDDVIVEDYIDGREFTVLVIEGKPGHKPDAFAIELVFVRPGEILDYDRKWLTFRDDCRWQFLDAEPLLHQQLIELAAPIFERHEFTHYCRFDVRMRATTRELYLLDINPFCGAFYPRHDFHSADLLIDRFIGHERFVRHLMACDCRRVLLRAGG